MSKKNRQKQKVAAKHQQQKAHRPAARLQLAEESFKAGDFAKAAAAAELALRAGNDPATQARGRVLLVESQLRQMPALSLHAQLHLLDHTLTHAPQEERLHYHRGLVLGRMGNFAEAAGAFKAALAAQSTRPGLAYLTQIARVAAGETVESQSLTASQRDTLQLLHALRHAKKGETASTILTGNPVAGNAAELWGVLFQMYDNKASVPTATYAKASQADAALAGNPVVAYYSGVLAMRQGKVEDAHAAWRTATQRLTNPWLLENLRNLRRERAAELAQTGAWPAIIELYQQTVNEMPAGEMDTVFSEIAGHAYFQLGFAAGQAGNWPEAYRCFQQADGLSKNRFLSQNLALAAEALEDWDTAATAWREMVRRRPRKENHPDYLTDKQVASIWSRIAHCYGEADNLEEAVTALKNAVKYAETNLELRITLADMLRAVERIDAAENELDRILEIEANHVPALTRLGALYTGRWDRDATSIWKRVLALEPNNEDARTALAVLYIQQIDRGANPFLGFAPPMNLGKKTPIQILQEGLEHVPNHPLLLVELGRQYHEKKKNKEAREHLMHAARVAPKDVMIMDVVLHELLHADGGAQVRELTPQVRSITGLRPSFWVEQGEKVFHCELGATWAQFFWDQAIETAQPMRGEDSPAAIMLEIFEKAMEFDEEKLANHYAGRLRKEHATSGAVEYIEAAQLFAKNPKKTAPIFALLKKAKVNAQKAGEPEIAEMAEFLEMSIKHPQMPSMFGGRNPLLDLFGNLDMGDVDIDEDDLFDAFRRAFR